MMITKQTGHNWVKQSKDHLVNILETKGTKNKLDYIRILGFGLELACN